MNKCLRSLGPALVSACLCCLGLGTVPLASAQEAGTIRGRVALPDSRIAADVTVKVVGTPHTAHTGTDGTFVIEGIAPGSYELEASLQGYFAASARLVVATGQAASAALTLGPAMLFGETIEVEGSGLAEDTTLMKTRTPLLETPFSIQVIPRQRIEEQKAQSLNEVLRYAAGVQSEQYGGLDQAFDFLTIRGFGGPSFDGLFRDGGQLYTFGFTGFRLEPYGAETVEVLRGATSVLYGQTGPGGVVNMVSKRPTAVPLREVAFEAGNYDHFQAKADLSGPLGGPAASWRYRLTGLGRDAGTQVDFVKNDRVFVAPALSWSGARTNVTFLGHYQKDRAAHFQFLPQVGTLDPSPNGVIPETRADGEPGFDGFDRKQYSAGYVLERRVSERLVLRQNTRYDHVDVDYRDVFGTVLDPTDPAGRTLTRATFTILGDTDVLSVDSQAQLEAKTGGLAHTLLLGVEYQHSTFDSTDGFGEAPPLDVFDPHYGSPVVRPEPYADARTTRSQVGLYAHDRVRLPAGLVAMVAGRQNFVASDVRDRLAGTTTEEDDHAFVWQGGLVLQNHLGLVPHVSYSESFQPVSGRDTSGKAYVPQTGRQYEVGLRYQPAQHRASIALAAFDLRRQNVLTADPQNPANQVQTGEVASRGVEVEAEAALARGLSLTAAYSYQDVEITKSNNGDVGLRPAAIPAHLASVWVHHAPRSGVLKGLGVGAGFRFQGTTFDETNTMEVEGATLFDAVLSYRLGKARLALNAQNVFDEGYVAGCSFGNCYYGRSRSLYGSVTYAW